MRFQSQVPKFTELTMLIHKEDKDYKCNICGVNTSSASLLKYHMDTHSHNSSAAWPDKELPYACPYCHYRSLCKDIMKIHMTEHKKQVIYVCDYGNCPFEGSTEALDAHRKTHIDPVYACGESDCHFACNSTEELVTHSKNHLRPSAHSDSKSNADWARDIPQLQKEWNAPFKNSKPNKDSRYRPEGNNSGNYNLSTPLIPQPGVKNTDPHQAVKREIEALPEDEYDHQINVKVEEHSLQVVMKNEADSGTASSFIDPHQEVKYEVETTSDEYDYHSDTVRFDLPMKLESKKPNHSRKTLSAKRHSSRRPHLPSNYDQVNESEDDVSLDNALDRLADVTKEFVRHQKRENELRRDPRAVFFKFMRSYSDQLTDENFKEFQDLAIKASFQIMQEQQTQLSRSGQVAEEGTT